MLTINNTNFIYIILSNNNFIVKGKLMQESKIHVQKRIFPRRLPQNFHGSSRQRPSLTKTHKQKYEHYKQMNPEDYTPMKIVNWQRKISTKDIINERRQMLVHPAKLSGDTPDWFKTTYDKFRRNEQNPRHRQTRAEWERFDVFGRQKVINYADKTNGYPKHRLSQAIEVADKIGTENRFRSTSRCEVTPKVGSVEFRDYSVRKPQMKVGKTDFIDTYSPF